MRGALAASVGASAENLQRGGFTDDDEDDDETLSATETPSPAPFGMYRVPSAGRPLLAGRMRPCVARVQKPLFSFLRAKAPWHT